MIDFHCHVIPKIDDGASSVEESLKILSMLEGQGIKKVIATPHYYGRHTSVNAFLHTRDNALSILKQNYDGGIEIVAGCEINLATCLNADLSDLTPLAIAGTNYALVEMSFEKKWSAEFWKRLDDFIKSTMLIPVIAHVEKYPAVIKKPSYASDLVDRGCLLQVNCDSVITAEKNSLVDALFRHNLVHCIGTDAHDEKNRPPRYAKAKEKIASVYGAQVLEKLESNSLAVLGDKLVDVGQYSKIKKVPLRKIYS